MSVALSLSTHPLRPTRPRRDIALSDHRDRAIDHDDHAQLLLRSDRGDRLRPWSVADAPILVETFADPSLIRQIGEPPSDLAAAERWINDRTAAWESMRGYSWAVVSDATIVGSATVSSVDRRHGTGWVSYWTTQAMRGNGVAAAALRALAQWSFDDLELLRLELGHRSNNPASCRVATAAGFRVEGLERQKLRYGCERFDVELHARLATDPFPPG